MPCPGVVPRCAERASSPRASATRVCTSGVHQAWHHVVNTRIAGAGLRVSWRRRRPPPFASPHRLQAEWPRRDLQSRKLLPCRPSVRGCNGGKGEERVVVLSSAPAGTKQANRQGPPRKHRPQTRAAAAARPPRPRQSCSPCSSGHGQASRSFARSSAPHSEPDDAAAGRHFPHEEDALHPAQVGSRETLTARLDGLPVSLLSASRSGRSMDAGRAQK